MPDADPDLSWDMCSFFDEASKTSAEADVEADLEVLEGLQ